MIGTIAKGTLFVIALLATGLGALAPLDARPDEGGRDKVTEGIGHFDRGDYEAAARAFADADVAMPGDPKIAFNRGCAAQAAGDHDKAIGYYMSAALAREAALAASARFNLGTLRVSEAMEIFGAEPESATPEQREEGIAVLGRAVRHFRDCLDVDTDHGEARHNLEGIRLWIKHMQALWEEKDRQKKRDELNVLQFLEMIQQAQLALRAGVKDLAGEADSPRRREAVGVTETAQRKLVDEIVFLKEKIEETLQPPPAQPGQPGQPQPAAASGEEIEKALATLKAFADEASGEMIEAADRLAGGSLEGAPEPQWNAVERLDRIFDALASFDAVVLKALRVEQGVVDGTLVLVEPEEGVVGATANGPDVEDDPTASGDDATARGDDPTARGDDPTAIDEKATAGSESGGGETRDGAAPPGASAAKPVAMDAADLALFQERVTGWADLIPLKAEHLEQQLAAQDGQPGGGAPAVPGQPAAGQPAGDAKAEEERENHRKACALAKEHGPVIRELSREAVVLLREERTEEALPKAEEALALLQEIAELLPKKEQQQQQQGDQGDQQEDQGENEQKQDEKTDEKTEQEEKDKAAREKERKDLSRREAEAVLGKAKEKERRHDEKKKELQEAIRAGKGAVEKDW